jgi:ubiquinone/menaquinone biosynthesis C-methylase UbiE
VIKHQVTLGLALLFSAVALAHSSAGQLGARPAEDWIKMLDAPARVAGLRIDEVLKILRLRDGEVVADLGAGTGVFSIPMARAVGPSGTVYAVEIEQGLVDHIAGKAREQQAPNVHAVLGRFTDPALPASDVDVVFMHDALHHVEDRRTFLKNVAGYIKPGGRFAIVEFDPLSGPHRSDPKLQISKAQLSAWMAELGFETVEEFDMFDAKWFGGYRRKR